MNEKNIGLWIALIMTWGIMLMMIASLMTHSERINSRFEMDIIFIDRINDLQDALDKSGIKK